MADPSTLPRRAFLRLAAGAGLAIGAGVAACDAALRAPSPGSATPGTSPTSPAATLTPSPTATSTPEPTPSPSRVPGPSPTPGPSIVAENRLTGSPGWERGLSNGAHARGYASPVSVEPGGSITLYVTSLVPYDIAWYRLGWYGGVGARQVRFDRGLPATPDHRRSFDRTTGMVEAPWGPAIQVEVPLEWRSGMYVAMVRPTDASGATGVPFIVRAPIGAGAGTLFLSAQATWRAYDAWGGKSLYAYNSRGDITPTGTTAAAAVSFDRPMALEAGLGFLRRWELPFVQWMERTGREVDYAADVDLELVPEILSERRFAVLAGHPEYWSRPMRRAMESAVAAGLNAAFLSANEIYWQVRLEPSPLGPGRRIVCYKSSRRDPLTRTQPSLATCRWREGPVLEPEARFLGVMYGHPVLAPGDWIVRRARHWLYEGTGLRNGDAITSLIGQEYDAYFPELAPAGTVIVAQGPVRAVDRNPANEGDVWSPAIHSAAVREPTSSRGGVFAAGTFQWSWALDPTGSHWYAGRRTPYDPRVDRMTANLFDRFGG